MSSPQVKKQSRPSVSPILTFVSDALGSHKKSISLENQMKGKMKTPSGDGGDQTEEARKWQLRYKELVETIHVLFLEVNNRYYNSNDINEKLNRKQNEFGYQRMEPTKLIDLIRLLLDEYIKGIIETEDKVQEYKLLGDEETQDYIWLLQKSERDMRQLIRENQQLKQLIVNQEAKLVSSEKQIELLTNYTQKAMEEMKQEFSFAIDLLAERESTLNILKDELKRKNDIIRSLDEQLISVLILEHKIGHLEQKQQKEKTKLKQEFNGHLKKNEQELKAHYELDNKMKESKIAQLEQTVKLMHQEKNCIESDLKGKLGIYQRQMDVQAQVLKKKIQRVQELQSQIVTKQVDDHIQIKMNHLSTRQVILNQQQ